VWDNKGKFILLFIINAPCPYLQIALEGTEGVESLLVVGLHVQGSLVVPHGARVVGAGPQQVSVQHVGCRLGTKNTHT
jgi:hypothetical protein